MIDALFNRLASGRTAGLLGLLYAVNQIAIGILAAPLGHDMLKVQITLSAETFSRIVMGWTPDQMAAYYRHFILDYPHPVLYALFLASAMAALSGKKAGEISSWFRLLFILPFIAGACDLLENTLHVILIPGVPDIPVALAALSGAATNVKWALAFICVVAVGVMGARRLWGRKPAGDAA